MPALQRLELHDFRCHSEVRLEALYAPWILLQGGNGAGKTSLLEAIYAASRGRSFRTPALSQVIRSGTQEARVFLRTTDGLGGHRLGAAFRRTGREIHLDEEADPSRARVSSVVPVEYLGGEKYRLLDGTPAARRRFLDWGLFHVEPRFFPVWRTWFKAHRQRNDLLRQGNRSDAAPWTAVVAQNGEALTAFRANFLAQLSETLRAFSQTLASFSEAALSFKQGWRENSLAKAFHASSRREELVGRAVVGPQYDDWQLVLQQRGMETLSRGQSKLICILLVRARAELMGRANCNALLLVDDLMADLDSDTGRRALGLLEGTGGQIWLSALDEGQKMAIGGPVQRFHVEPGTVRVG